MPCERDASTYDKHHQTDASRRHSANGGSFDERRAQLSTAAALENSTKLILSNAVDDVGEIIVPLCDGDGHAN